MHISLIYKCDIAMLEVSELLKKLVYGFFFIADRSATNSRKVWRGNAIASVPIHAGMTEV